jgi:hypothetical protein
MSNMSLDSLVGLVLAQNRELKKMARNGGKEPTGYSMFDADGHLLTSGYLYPFELMFIAQLLREGDLVIVVRKDDMPDDSYVVNEPQNYVLIADREQRKPGLSALAEIACLVMWRKDGVHHVVPRDYGNSPLQGSGIKVTSRSAALFRRVIAGEDPTAILR